MSDREHGDRPLEQFVASDALISELARRRIYFTYDGANRFAEGTIVRFAGDAVIERYAAALKGNTLGSMGAFSYSWSSIPKYAGVGRYCSIADNVQHMGSRHPLAAISTSSFTGDRHFSIFTSAIADEGIGGFAYKGIYSGPYDYARIEHDVWIGDGALIGRNITLGTGSVVAARSVVTKSVPPFAIVAGAPAVIKRYRFEEDLVERILGSRWWDYMFTSFSDTRYNDADRFLDDFHQRREAGKLRVIETARPFSEVIREITDATA